MSWDGVDRRSPDFWRRWGVALVGIGCVVIMTLVIIGYYVVDDLDDRLTPLEQAPCRLEPGSTECQQVIDGILKTMTPRQAHLIERKADQYP